MHLSSDVFVELTGRRSNEFEEELEKLIKFQREKLKWSLVT